LNCKFNGGRLEGEFRAPPSKSYTHRAIILASTADGESTIERPLVSFDTMSTMDAMRSMGATVGQICGALRIKGVKLHPPAKPIDVGNSGTTLRLLSGLVSSFDSPVTLTGDDSIKKRPMGPLLDALASMGVKCISNDGKPPVTIKGPNLGGDVSVRGDMSSQFISSLIMSAPFLKNDSHISVKGDLVSKPYINITLKIMRDFGIEVCEDNGYHVKGMQRYKARDYIVPADMSSAAFPIVGGALSGHVTMKGFDAEDPQGDKKIIDIVKTAGADVKIDGNDVTVSISKLSGCDVDMSEIPDLFPIVAVLLSTADGRSELYGAPHLRHKESDRIDSVTRMLKTLGADIEPTEGGCIINGVKKLKGGTIDHMGDHRIMMSAAIASLVSNSPVFMKDAECCSVSYPDFIDTMQRMGMSVCTD